MNKILLASSFKLGELLKPIIATPMLIHNFGLEYIGLYTLVISLVVICYPLIDGGLLTFSQRVFYNSSNHISTKGIDCIKVQLLFSPLIICLFSLIFSLFLDSLSDILVSVVYLFFFSISSSLNGFFRAQGKIVALATIKIFFDVLEIVSISLFIFLNTEFTLQLFAYLALIKFLFFISQLFWLFGMPQSYIFKPINWTGVKDFYRVAYTIVPVALIGAAAGNAERFIIEDVLGTIALGSYIVLMQFVFYLKMLVFPITFIKLPELSKVYDDEGGKALVRTLNKLLAVTFIITIFACASFWVLRKFIYEWWLNIELTAMSEYTIVLLLLSVVCMNLNSILLLGFTVLERLRIFSLFNAIILILTIVLNLHFLEFYGFIASAFILFILNLMLVILSYYRFKYIIRSYC